MDKLVLIDSNALVHRSFHALPPLKNKQGLLTNAVYGFCSILIKVIKDLEPKYIAAAYDLEKPTFRHKQYEEYKATRKKAPDELYEQIPKTKSLLDALGITILEKEGYEADDVIGTIAEKTKNKNIETYIVTGDLDTLQLVDDNIKVYTLRKGVKDTTIYGEKEVKERFELEPEQLLDYKGLRGDPSDNIPGVSGIGEKTATALLKEFKTIENLYKKIEKMKEEKIKKHPTLTPRIASKLKEEKEMAIFSKELGTIQKNVPVKVDIKKFEWKNNMDKEKIKELFNELEFQSLLKRIPFMEEKENSKQANLF
ncbi:MAG: hypothetical protein GF387_01890 [Candidatus Portnoybacteria bacterium]|nr:hypothetical protein [Candidatus Portnoybacteria bacterium]